MVLMSGCSSKEENQLMEAYSTKMMHYKKLQQTEKLLLYENNITQVVLTATYLYDKGEDRGSENNETFIIGLNIADKDIVNLTETYGLRDLKQEKIDSDLKKLKISQENNETNKKVEGEDNSEIILAHAMDKNISFEVNLDKNVTEKDYDYQLTLNGKKAISIEKLELNDSRLNKLSFISEWNTYALVTFKYIKSNRLTMIFDSKVYGKGTLVFSKKAKYTY